MEQLQSRDELRGTGRTLRQLKAAIEHAKTTNWGTLIAPLVWYVVANREEIDYIRGLLQKNGHTVVVYRSRNEIKVDDNVRIMFHVATSRGFDSLRGYQQPIFVDHNVVEKNLLSPEFLATFQHRIIY